MKRQFLIPGPHACERPPRPFSYEVPGPSPIRRAWREKVEASGALLDQQAFWSLLRSFSGSKTPTSPSQQIAFRVKLLSSPASIARTFCRQFTLLPAPDNAGARRHGRMSRRIRRDHFLNLFTPELVRAAILKSGTSIACGPPPASLGYHINHLIDLYNLSLAAQWCLRCGSYLPSRQSSSPASPLPRAHPTTRSPRCPPQSRYLSGFCCLTWPMPSSWTNLNSICHLCAPASCSPVRGQRKPPSRTLALAVDLSKAFDTVPHNLLISRIIATDLYPNIKRWLKRSCRLLFLPPSTLWLPQHQCWGPTGLSNFPLPF